MPTLRTAFVKIGWLIPWLISGSVLAQQRLIWEAYGHIGGLTSRQREPQVDTKAVWGTELTVSRQTTGKQFWQRAHGFPEMGLTLRWRNLGNTSMYGSDVALVPFLAFSLWRSRVATLQLKHGTGLAYFTRQYDVAANPNNQLISTRLNAVSLLNLGLLVHATSQLDLKVGVELNHASNGNLRQPNSGLNTITAYAGLRYVPGQWVEVLRESVLRRRHNWRGYACTAFGIFQSADSSRLAVLPQLEGGILFEHDVRFRASAGLEIGYHPDDVYQLGVKVGEEVLFGHLAIRYQLGAYLNRPVEGSRIYEKVGIAWYPFRLRNNIPDRLNFGTALKAHGLRAAFIEVSAGYVF
ncbi:acyloxyacyl hydrolase [Spirosoma sp. BT702]|uniref:Acyloxyacyl hydrolase n=1 Tax=Spirosoma profusum TaxID=2771354 RepID=A0A926XXS4_9BACT|nr:acyloxyacyl hydrolase [Spirosoma profusum]MBD2702874.1 acyloxyacyl hydrolase [Spirosoma profusum]